MSNLNTLVHNYTGQYGLQFNRDPKISQAKLTFDINQYIVGLQENNNCTFPEDRLHR